jgi:hypothetical protein
MYLNATFVLFLLQLISLWLIVVFMISSKLFSFVGIYIFSPCVAPVMHFACVIDE